MAVRIRDLSSDWRAGDAERLARLMNDASAGWPNGTWDPKTPEQAARNVRERRMLGTFVAVEGDLFISHCNLYAKPGEKHEAYVPFLTALPEYHGKGYGKAVLLAAVERVYELGIARVDLHTWPGNLKAVPLYKKSGFMWNPDEPWGVHMQNFTPGARRHPVAAAFFARHDWYRTMKRSLELVPDDHKRGKVRVYPYQWEEGGERLRMVFDRQSWGLIEIENQDFLINCSLEDEKLVTGVPQRVRWEIVNYTGSPLDIALVASGDPGVDLDRKEVFRVKDRAELAARFTVSPDIPSKEKEPRAAIIKTDLLVNGMPVTLAAGFEAKQPVHFSLHWWGVGTQPRREETVVLHAWSELDRPAEAKLRISGSGNTALAPNEATVKLPAKGSAEVPLAVTVAEPGPFEVKAEAEVRVGKRTLKPKPGTMQAHAVAPGDLAGHVAKDEVVLESSTLRLTVWRRGGGAQVFDKLRTRNIAGIRPPLIGPPLAWDEFFDTPCEARIEETSGRITAVLSTASIHREGLRLERRLTLTNLPLIETQDTLINASSAPVEGRIQLGAGPRLWGGHFIAPTNHGIVRGPMVTAGRGFGEHSLSEKGEDWPEGWVAAEDRDGVTVGIIWDQAHTVLWRWGMLFERAFPKLRPGQAVSLSPTYVFAGEGDYFTVRRWWQMLHRPAPLREHRHPETRQPLEFGLQAKPLVLHGRAAKSELVVDSVGELEFAGTLTVAPAAGLTLKPRRLEFSGVKEGNAAAETVMVSRRATLPEGGYFVESTLRLDRAEYRERQPVLVLGDPDQEVTIRRAGEREELFVVENGRLALTVAPGFGGSATSLKRGREELLRSAYPTARPLAWENPWFGGISPGLNSLGQDMAKETFTAKEIARRGAQGVRWRGVRLTCLPKEERGRFDKLEVDYLLAPGSGIIAVALRTTRRTGTPGWLHASFSLWPVLGGSFLEAELRACEDERCCAVRTEFGRGFGGKRWVGAVNAKAEQAVVLASGDPDANVGGQIFGRDGYFLHGDRGGLHEGRETKESAFFISFTEMERAQDLAAALSALEALP
jgi:GNAT superfamily N-acetyltransferase